MKSYLKIENKKTIVFIISLVISTFMWLLIKLSQEYEIMINIPLTYENMPADKYLIEKADSVLKVNVTDNGFDLLGGRLFGTSSPYHLDISTFKQQKLSKGRTKYYMITKSFYDQVKGEFGSSTKIDIHKPDSLVFIFEKLSSKNVKIVPKINFSLAPQFQLSEEITLQPETITLFGSVHDLAKIDTIYTEAADLHHLETDTEIELSLLISPLVSSKIKSCKLIAKVEQFTEASLDIPIQTHFDESKTIKIFPNHVQIKYAISLDRYHSIKADQFHIKGIIDTLSIGKLNIVLEDIPSHIRLIDYSPKMVEYIIIE